MSQRRNLPSKKYIVEHWNKKYNMNFDDKTCWTCGLEDYLDRCHLHARVYSNDDSESNLVLCCRFCHSHLQENQCNTDEGRKEFIEMLLDGTPYMSIRVAFFYEALQKGILKLKRYESASNHASDQAH
jgi:hypothetical protein